MAWDIFFGSHHGSHRFFSPSEAAHIPSGCITGWPKASVFFGVIKGIAKAFALRSAVGNTNGRRYSGKGCGE